MSQQTMSNFNNTGTSTNNKFKLPVYGFKLFKVSTSAKEAVTADEEIDRVEKKMNEFSEQLPEHHILDLNFFQSVMTGDSNRADTVIILRYIKYNKEQWEKARDENEKFMNRPSSISL